MQFIFFKQDKNLPIEIKKVKALITILLICNSFFLHCQYRNDSKWNNGTKYAVAGFNTLNLELGYSWVNPDSYGLEVSSEFLNFDNLLIGPKLTLKKFFYLGHTGNSELYLYNPSLGLENVLYTDFKENQYCIRPIIGIHVLEFLEVNYGYSLFLKGNTDFQLNLNRHSFSIVLRWANLRDME